MNNEHIQISISTSKKSLLDLNSKKYPLFRVSAKKLKHYSLAKKAKISGEMKLS